MLPVICLMGPTASGKTQLALRLAEHFACEIISVDSVMVYRGMDIGSAKPTLHQRKNIPHHLIDICDPAESYSAGRFTMDTLQIIEALHAQGKIPLLAGGTMLYFNVLQKGLSGPSSHSKWCELLRLAGGKLGWPALHAKLSIIDPVAAAKIHPHDAKRIIRALEVYLSTGKNLTHWHSRDASSVDAKQIINIGIAPGNRSSLHKKIEQRFLSMLEKGLVEEVSGLLKQPRPLSLMTPAMRSVGYRQVGEYLQGQYTYKEMCAKAIAATRQVAKRQLTWLRSWHKIQWFDSDAIELPALIEYLRNEIIRIRQFK